MTPEEFEREDEFTCAVMKRIPLGVKCELQSHYDPDGDCVEVVELGANFYAKRIDKFMTFYIERETGAIKGCLIKGVKKLTQEIISRIPGFRQEIHSGRVPLHLLCSAHIWIQDAMIAPPAWANVKQFRARVEEQKFEAEVGDEAMA